MWGQLTEISTKYRTYEKLDGMQRIECLSLSTFTKIRFIKAWGLPHKTTSNVHHARTPYVYVDPPGYDATLTANGGEIAQPYPQIF